MSEPDEYAAKQKLREAPDEAFTRFSQHILHEVGLQFNKTNARFAVAGFSEFAESSGERWVALSGRRV
jgi:hypothetical protein